MRVSCVTAGCTLLLASTVLAFPSHYSRPLEPLPPFPPCSCLGFSEGGLCGGQTHFYLVGIPSWGWELCYTWCVANGTPPDSVCHALGAVPLTEYPDCGDGSSVVSFWVWGPDTYCLRCAADDCGGAPLLPAPLEGSSWGRIKATYR